MNHFSHHLRRTAVLAVLLLIPAALTAAPVDEPTHSLILPLVMTQPGVVAVSYESELREAIEAANAAGQMPRIEVMTDIALYAPLPMFDNPRGGTAVIDGNGHTIDGNLTGTVLAFGPGTTAVVEDITITGGSGNQGWGERLGGGIYTEGRLTVRRSRITGNAARYGGGIALISRSVAADGRETTLTLEQTTLSGNVAYSNGGGLLVYSLPGDIRLTALDSTLESNAATLGGGINVEAYGGDIAITLAGSSLRGNAAERIGGAIYAYADGRHTLSLDVEDSTLSNNHAELYEGGAIYAHTYRGFIAIGLRRSAVVLNSAPGAAALYIEGDPGQGGRTEAALTNSTFSGNVSTGGGTIVTLSYSNSELFGPYSSPALGTAAGGAFMQLRYSTVTGGRGGGVANRGQTDVFGSIIAGNEGGDCLSPLSSRGYNLDGDGSCGLDQPTDLPGGRAGLLPLVLNPPGTTSTHALGPDSQARNRIPIGQAGCNPAADTDQRGVARPQPASGLCDIGAYEAER